MVHRSVLLLGLFSTTSMLAFAQSPRLLDREWRMLALHSAPAAQSGAQAQPTLLLNSKTGHASGFAGCNQWTGTFTQTGDKIEFGPIARSKRACATGMEIESAFLEHLRQTRSMATGVGALELLDGKGKLLVRFNAASTVSANERTIPAGFKAHDGFAARSVSYRCAGGKALTVEYLHLERGVQLAALAFKGKVHVLQAEAGSASYSALNLSSAMRWQISADLGLLSTQAATAGARATALLKECRALKPAPLNAVDQRNSPGLPGT